MFNELKIKRILKRNITMSDYRLLSVEIKKDSRVVAHFIKCNPDMISFLDSTIDISSYVLNDYSLLKYLNQEQLDFVFRELDLSKVEMTREFFNKLSLANQNVAFRQFPITCIGYFKSPQRLSIIEKIIDSKENFNLYDLFSSEEFKFVILNLQNEELLYLLDGKASVKRYVTNIISGLDEESLMKLYGRCSEIYRFLPEESKQIINIKNAGDNLFKISQLDEDTQIKIFKNNQYMLRCASESVIKKYVNSVDELSLEVFILNGKKGYRTDVYKIPEEEFVKFLSSDFSEMFWYCNFKHDNVDHLGRFVFKKIGLLNDLEKKEKLKQLYNSLTDKIIFSSMPALYYRENYQISKLLFDDNVIRNNSVELLKKYKDTFDREILIEILSNAYGDHVREIFNGRPNLDIIDIDNLNILNKGIYDVLGKGFVDYVLNCSLDFSNYLIYQLANDFELLQTFSKYFNSMTSDIEELDINIISNLIEKFMVHKDVFEKLDFDNLSDERKKKINLLIHDIDMVTVYVRSVEDLDNYFEIRNNRFMEYVDEIDDVSQLRDIIFAYVSGRGVDDRSCEYTLENLTFDLIIKVFDIMTIVENDDLIKKMNLNNDDVSILLLLHEIARVRDVNVLKNTFEALVNRGLDSKLFASTFDKIKDYYVRDVKNNLLSSEKIDEMEKELVDGVEVVSLEGEPFTLLTSVTGVNLSSNSLAKEVFGHSLLYDWLYRERGLNTISTSICSSDTSIYPAPFEMWRYIDRHITLVFDNSVGIVGMGGSDISSSHVKKSRKHAFNYIEQNDFGFSSMKDLKNRINKNNSESVGLTKFSSEVTIARFFEDIRCDDGGKRVMPIGIYVIGEITPDILETAKVFNQYYEENGLGKFRIIKVNPKVYKGEGNIVNNASIASEKREISNRRW